ncbi:MAG TPA: NADPH-dependent glutamate synthase [Blastocatellia bacterium]|jgi:glutamate synthase (NADPH/NADH) small chain
MSVEQATKIKRTPKQPRQSMPCQDPFARGHNFLEVALGFTEEQALLEAQRCINCKNPTCITGCPVEINIPRFITSILNRDYAGAAHIIREKNSLPAVCGRVCQQEDQCELKCVNAIRGTSVGIGRLERFVADYEMDRGAFKTPRILPATGRRIALVGSGPASLTAAGDLARMGHRVTVFEALHKIGGVLVYGIPEFRLPKSILEAEIRQLENIGVEFVTSFVVGKTETVDELFDEEGYDAVFLATGAGLPYFLNVPGENLAGIYSANEFLTRVNLMKAYRFPEYDTPVRLGKTVAVLGAGNTAMDAARVALRLGPDKVYVIYRRSRAEVPARAEEVEHAMEEGIDFRFLTTPVRFFGNSQGCVTGMEVVRMELGEPDESGRRRPVMVKGSEHTLDIDTVIVAVGQGPNPLVQSTTPGLDTNRRGNILTDETGMTSRPGLYAGGDVVRGGSTVILAMGDGKRAARAIDEYLKENGRR